MELELEPRVRPLTFKVKAMSRESPAQKAAHVLETDLRTHWSTATNTKEWILLELDEACLLSHIRIYNKAVLEWEITAGLRFKPEAFVKVRPRCEAPRRDMVYPMNYTPCRYVRISCLRGNPIAIFFIQLIGVPVPGLEPEFQPVVNYLLPNIVANKQDTHDMHLQLLQDMTVRLLPFLPQLEADLNNFADAAESNTRLFAMLAGPFYPILRLVNEREPMKTLLNPPESDASKGNQTSMPTVSSNFEAQPRRSRSPSFLQPASSSIAFRSDAVIVLLRKAYKDTHLGIVCRRASRALQKLGESITVLDESVFDHDLAVSSDEVAKVQVTNLVHLADYSSLFGEEFKILESSYDDAYLNVLDIAAVEEGILHVLYASASQPLLCCKLADNSSNLWSILPLVQALLPALRPPNNSSPLDQVDDSFFQWKHPPVQHALSQIVNVSSSSIYHPLLHACAGYLSSFVSSHGKAACVLIDLCSGPLSPWIPIIIAKMDLTIELLEDLLGVIQGVRQSIARARAALKYVILAISGHMDDVLAKYKEIKHKLLFLLEMLEPFLDPAITAMKNTISFGDVSALFLEKQERTCAVALNVIRMAVQRPAVLPSLESEWRRGSVLPSVLLSILCPNMPLPPDIDLCRGPASKIDQESSTVSPGSTVYTLGGSSISCSSEDIDGKNDTSEGALKMDVFGDSNLLFAPRELKQCVLTTLASPFLGTSPDKINLESNSSIADDNHIKGRTFTGIFQLDNVFAADYYNMQADYLQLIVYKDRELRTAEFQRLSLDLCSQPDITPEGHNAGIDALLLAAECYVNPFFMMSFRPNSELIKQMNSLHDKLTQENAVMELTRTFQRKKIDLEMIAHLEKKRDKTVLDILLQAAMLDSEYHRRASYGEPYADDLEEDEPQFIEISQQDIQFADAVTLVRKHQALLCHFIMRQFQREQHSSHEVLLQSLLFLLQSATKLFCAPENVIDIILQSAENLNRQLGSLYPQIKAGKMQLDMEKLHGLRRRWGLLKNIVIASSGNDDVMEFPNITKNGFQYRSLVPPSSWVQKISKFSSYACPLPRFLGWMAISRYAKQYLSGQLFLASDFSQLTSLLSIFADELAFIDNIAGQKVAAANIESFETKCLLSEKECGSSSPSDTQHVFKVLHPDLHLFFPTLKNQFGSFEETILEAVGLHLKCLPCSAVADVLCWLSDICLWPYVEDVKDSIPYGNTADSLKRCTTINAKAVVLYLIESIISEHMEAIIPEMPRITQILLSLTKASYSDVTFLESVLCLLQPLISYFLRMAAEDEKRLANGSNTQYFGLLNFDELFESIRCKKESQDASGKNNIQVALVIFILGYLFPDLTLRTKIEILESLLLCVDFTTSEPTSSFHNYLSAFQKVMDSCDVVLVRNVNLLGINNPLESEQVPVATSSLIANDSLQSYPKFPDSADQNLIGQTEDLDSKEQGADFSPHEVDFLSASEIKEFSDVLEKFIIQLVPAIEASWKLHYKLSMKLVVSVAKCMLFSRCLHSFFQASTLSENSDGERHIHCDSSDLSSQYWANALVDLAGVILATQQNQCWQAAISMLDFLLELPRYIFLECVLSKICTAIKHFCHHAPRISWRLQTDKWLSSLVTRGIGNFTGETALVDLFCTMLGHPEPEQRSIALHHLGGITNMSSNIEANRESYRVNQLVGFHSTISLSESTLSSLVSKTWDIVAALALSDPSMLLRLHAMALLSYYIPFAERNQLCTFLVSSNTILQCTGKLSCSIEEGYLTQLSLVLLANACLYSPAEDIALIPESVWKNVETMGKSRTGLAYMEKKLCQILCELRNEYDGGKSALKEVLSSSSTVKHSDPSFKNTRESILQVLSSLTSVKSYFDFFSKRIDQESQELEEMEIEMEILQKEKALQEVSDRTQEDALQIQTLPNCKVDIKANDRLRQIKDNIRSLERSKLKEEIMVRRQRKLMIKHTREKYLEETDSREMELLQELDRERAREMERELERQRQLELERAKTRELQFNLDLEREKQTQRDLQQELEQVESGVRSSRREYSSNPNSRPRERYHERENARTGRQEGSIRSSSRGRESVTSQMTSTGPSVSPSPNVVLAGSRSFSGHLPTILQSKDRTEERSAGYEDSIEGSKDSGDASSVGDPEIGSAFDGLAGGYGSVSRHGSRGSKSRQVVERRERDGRREGKWERKHS